MQEEIIIIEGADDQPEEIIIIDIAEVFHGRQSHPEHHPEHHHHGKHIRYVIQVDKKRFRVKAHEMTGAELLALVKLTPDKYRLFEIGKEQREILPNEKVDFKKCEIERFKSVAKHANEGTGAAVGAAPLSIKRKQFQLLPDDERFLNAICDSWETILSGNTGWILLPSYKLPNGYNVKEATVAFMLPPSYPTVEFDMMYFCPAINRADGKPIGALSIQPLDGKSFQRWSRHRNPGDWRPGVDNVETHFLSVHSWLNDELLKR